MYWKIFYDDLTTFSSEDGIWEDAPSDGVLFVVEYRDDERNVHSGNDYYAMLEDTVMSTGDLGPILRKLGIVKFGRWTSHRVMEKVSQMVREDKWLP